jgi:hypothetical protein
MKLVHICLINLLYFISNNPDVFHLILKIKLRQKHNNYLLLNI